MKNVRIIRIAENPFDKSDYMQNSLMLCDEDGKVIAAVHENPKN